jgi:hypothetical protein
MAHCVLVRTHLIVWNHPLIQSYRCIIIYIYIIYIYSVFNLVLGAAAFFQCLTRDCLSILFRLADFLSRSRVWQGNNISFDEAFFLRFSILLLHEWSRSSSNYV